jgi:hypothetical protein
MPSRDEARSHQQPEGTENRCSVLGDPSPFSFAMSVAQQSRVDQRSAGAPRLSSSISLCLSFLLGKSCSRLINTDEASSEIWLVGRQGHVCLPRHGAAALRLPPGLALVGGVEVHLLVAALLAAEGRVALVHEDVAVAGQRLGAERAGVQPVAALLAQRLGVEEEGACDGRGHFSFFHYRSS